MTLPKDERAQKGIEWLKFLKKNKLSKKEFLKCISMGQGEAMRRGRTRLEVEKNVWHRVVPGSKEQKFNYLPLLGDVHFGGNFFLKNKNQVSQKSVLFSGIVTLPAFCYLPCRF